MYPAGKVKFRIKSNNNNNNNIEKYNDNYLSKSTLKFFSNDFTEIKNKNNNNNNNNNNDNDNESNNNKKIIKRKPLSAAEQRIKSLEAQYNLMR